MSEPFSSCFMAMVDDSVVRTSMFCRPLSINFLDYFSSVFAKPLAIMTLFFVALRPQTWAWRADYNLNDDDFVIPDEIAS